MERAQPPDVDHFRRLAGDGMTAVDIYARVRLKGHSKLDAIRVIRELFGLSFQEAESAARQANDPGPNDLPPINSRADLMRVLTDELGYCGCAAYDDAIRVLRHVLRSARDWQSALNDADDSRRSEAMRSMLDRLHYEQVPGLATWFLYSLDHHNLIGHAGNITICWIERRGEQLLDAIEHWYPGTNDSD